jgi:hypothetical protein
LIDDDPPSSLPRGQNSRRPTEPGLGLGRVVPVAAGAPDLVEPGRHLHLEDVVRAAGLEQQHFQRRVLRQPRGDRAPGRAGPDDDDVELVVAVMAMNAAQR